MNKRCAMGLHHVAREKHGAPCPRAGSKDGLRAQNGEKRYNVRDDSTRCALALHTASMSATRPEFPDCLKEVRRADNFGATHTRCRASRRRHRPLVYGREELSELGRSRETDRRYQRANAFGSRLLDKLQAPPARSSRAAKNRWPTSPRDTRRFAVKGLELRVRAVGRPDPKPSSGQSAMASWWVRTNSTPSSRKARGRCEPTYPDHRREISEGYAPNELRRVYAGSG